MQKEKPNKHQVKRRISIGPEEWTVLANLLKRVRSSKKFELNNQEDSIIRVLDEKIPPACNEECKDFNERGLPNDFDTRMIAYMTTSPLFEEEDRTLILEAVMRYNPPKDRPLQRLTVHVIREFRKALIAPREQLEGKVHNLSSKVNELIKELESKENYSQKLLNEIAYLTASIQAILNESSGKVEKSEAVVIDAFTKDVPKEKIIEIIKDQNQKIIDYFKAESQKASQDALTGLYNRGAFDFHLQQFIGDCKTSQTPLTLLLIDIDHFKRFNDTYGHLVGDEAIKFVTQKGIHHSTKGFSSTIRARYGGEEFAVIMKGVDTRKASSIAETLRKNVESTPFIFVQGKDKKEEKITVSIGIGELDGTHCEPKMLIDKADKALYKAKQEGRNKVCTC